MKKIHQHYVPRFYLKAWATHEQIYCLRNGKIFRTRLVNVANEKYFYRLRDLTAQDIRVIEELAIKSSPPSLQPLHRNLVTMLTLPLNMKNSVDNSHPLYREFCAELDKVEANMEEDYHAAIEQGLQPAIAAMLAGNIEFYTDEEAACEFFYAMATQYMRTKNIREAVVSRSALRLDGYDINRAWNVLSHIFATNVGWSLFRDRSLFRIVLLDNPFDTPLITGDQPIINLHANLVQDAVPEKMEWFYPLSSSKAMLLVEAGNTQYPAHTLLVREEVERYNVLIAKNSYEQLFSNSEESLERMKSYLG